MLVSFKRLLLGVGLILLAGTILLISDWGSRKSVSTVEAKKELPAIAVFQYSSTTIMDEFCGGAIAALAANGFVDGKTVRLARFNSESDVATANQVAKQITDGSYRMIITASTICLQAVANANRTGARTLHIFGAVTDPFVSGVGINRDNPLQKPPYLTGMGTFQPVDRIIRQAKELFPGLKSIGVVWNPAEANSEACVIKARATCKALGIVLLEAAVEKPSDVREAASSLAVRGAQAYWTGGDATVNTAVDALIKVAQKERIPVFSNMYGQARTGGLFDLGADYYEVGYAVGEVASKVLQGTSPADIPVTDLMPERVMVNYQVLRTLKDKWHFTDDLVARADTVIGPDGAVRQVEKKQKPALK